MGWTWTHKPHDVKAVEFLRKQYTFTDGPASMEVLADALVQRSVWYAVIKRTAPTGEVIHFLAVTLVKFANSEFNIGWKEMEDTMGPCETSCPERILDLADQLAPLDDENDKARWGRDWRARCRARIAKRKGAAKPGDRIAFSAPIKFTDGTIERFFELVKRERRIVFKGNTSGLHFRISNWQERDYAIVEVAA